jgi:hypothetical protein
MNALQDAEQQKETEQQRGKAWVIHGRTVFALGAIYRESRLDRLEGQGVLRCGVLRKFLRFRNDG